MIETTALWIGYGFMAIGGVGAAVWLLIRLYTKVIELILTFANLKAWTIISLGLKYYRSLPPEEKAKYKHVKGV